MLNKSIAMTVQCNSQSFSSGNSSYSPGRALDQNYVDKEAEVNISSYPATDVAGSFFLSRRAEILNSGGFMQKYSDQGVSCKNIGQ